MATDDLNAVQRDLDAMRAALDLDGATVDGVRGHALIALAGLVTLLWVALAPPPLQFWGLLSVLIPSGYLVAVRARHREASGGSPAVRREFGDGLRVLLLGVPIVAYTLWAQRLGVPPLTVLATTVFFIGVMMFGGSRHQPALAFWGVTMMAGAFVLPANLTSPVVVIGAVLAVAGTAGAIIARFDEGR
jgi:hypothetical protein